MKVGDFHNFGRQVHCEVISGKNYYIKPRTVLWEYLLFSSQSPLKELLEDFFSSNFYKFNIFSKDNFKTGYSEEIISNLLIENVKPEYLGEFMGYCNFFGITDMTKENCIAQDDTIHLVDCECIFSPEAKFLTNIGKNFKQYSQSIMPIKPFDGSQKFILSFLQGYIDSWLALLTYREKIMEVFESLRALIEITPIRVLLKNTFEYASSKQDNFSIEDIIQLKRNDIPYYFSFLGTKDVLYYISSELKYTKISQDVDHKNHHVPFLSIGEFFCESRLLGEFRSNLYQITSYSNQVLGVDNFSHSFNGITLIFNGKQSQVLF